MAKNLAFTRGGSTSWADDEDDFQPPVMAPKLVKVEETHQEDEPEHRENHRVEDDNYRGGNRNEGDRRSHRGGNEERGRDHHRGESYTERPKNPVPDHSPFKIFVGNLPFRMNENDLADFLGHEGIIDIRFPKDHDTNRPKGFAYVEFRDREALVRSLDLDGHDIDGRAVKIDVAVERERKPRQKDNSWYTEKRHDRHRREQQPEENNTVRERPKLTLLPRSASTETPASESAATKASIFGDAKPRDEAAYIARQHSKELERKQHVEEDVKSKTNGETANKKQHHDRGARRNSHDEMAHSVGRGSGRGRGRGERVQGERPGGRGDSRGRGEGGRGGGRHERSVKKEDVAPAARKQESRAKRTTPVKTKIMAPTSTKTQNTFDLLGDSDSD